MLCGSVSFRRPERGFTLFEVAVGLLCLLIIVAAALPGVHWIRHEISLWTSAQLLESSLRWGRYQAVTSNCSVSVEVAEGGRSYALMDASTGEGMGSSIRPLGYQVSIVAAPRRPVRFFPSGRAAPAGTYVLQGRAGTYRVIVQPSGRIRVQRD